MEGRTFKLEMDIEITGLTIEETIARKREFIDKLKKHVQDDLLTWTFGNTTYQLHRRYEDEDKGTSG